MKAALYARKSLGENSRSSIDSQIDAIIRFCDSHNIEIVKRYVDDGVRGWEVSRPGLNAMMTAVHEKDCPFQIIIVFEWDRLFRKYAEAEKVIDEIESCGILTASVNGGIVSNRNEKLGQKLSLFVAEIENLMRGEHVLAGQIHWARLGYVVGGRPPYGFVRDVVEDTKGHIRFRYRRNENEAAIVRRIYEMRIKGAKISEILHSLNKDRIPSPEGKEWQSGTIHKILYSPGHQEKYIGNMLFNISKHFKKQKKSIAKSRYEWVSCKKSHPAIISEDMILKINLEKDVLTNKE